MADNSLGAKVGSPVVLPVIGEITAWTPTLAGGGTLSNVSAWYVRRGSMMKAWGTIQVGTVTATTAALSLPAGTTFDSSKFVNSRTKFGTYQVGTSSAVGVWTNGISGVMVWDSVNLTSSQIGFEYQVEALLAIFSARSATSVLNSTSVLAFEFEIPIAEWAGSANVAYGAGLATSAKAGLITTEYSTTIATTFTFNGTGGGTSASVNVVAYRLGKTVTLTIPNVVSTTGSAGTTAFFGPILPADLRPAVTKSSASIPIVVNSVKQATSGYIEVASSGQVAIYRDNSLTAYGVSLPSTGVGTETTISYQVP